LQSRSASELGKVVAFQFEFFTWDHSNRANTNILSEITFAQTCLPS
jgi:hypothetical protein